MNSLPILSGQAEPEIQADFSVVFTEQFLFSNALLAGMNKQSEGNVFAMAVGKNAEGGEFLVGGCLVLSLEFTLDCPEFTGEGFGNDVDTFIRRWQFDMFPDFSWDSLAVKPDIFQNGNVLRFCGQEQLGQGFKNISLFLFRQSFGIGKELIP